MKLRRAAFGLTAFAVGLILISGPGTRLGLFGFRIGLLILAAAVVSATLAFTVSVVALLVPRLRGRDAEHFALPLVVCLVVMAGPAVLARKARSLPLIHDITTDVDHPPAFVDLVAIRKAASAENPPEYPGAETAALQRKAYVGLSPLDLTIPPGEAFARAVEVAREMGWEIVAEKAAEGRIEATATTVWFGFKDDIVVRVAAFAGGSRIDVRSKSRVGRSDLGANAARIKAYLARLK